MNGMKRCKEMNALQFHLLLNCMQIRSEAWCASSLEFLERTSGPSTQAFTWLPMHACNAHLSINLVAQYCARQLENLMRIDKAATLNAVCVPKHRTSYAALNVSRQSFLSNFWETPVVDNPFETFEMRLVFCHPSTNSYFLAACSQITLTDACINNRGSHLLGCWSQLHAIAYRIAIMHKYCSRC